jgi:hypothetical protein
MASNPQERLNNNDNDREDIPEYMKKIDSLNTFDNKYSLLREKDKDLDDLYLKSKNNQIELKNYIDQETNNYIDNKLKFNNLNKTYKNINDIKNTPEFINYINSIKQSEYYKKLENKQEVLQEELDEKEDDFNKRFNQQYLINRDKRFNKLKKEEERRLQQLNEIKYKKKLHEYTIGDFLFSFKDNIFFVINALLNKNYDIKTYTENYRLLHIGLLIIFLCIILLILKIDPYKNNINLK